MSYAQNAEDLMLWRALRDVAGGFWIDVGAADPDDMSVTRAFRDRGWSGINVEPNPRHLAKLRASRSGEVTLGVAVGATAAERAFHLIGDTGLSTLDASVASRHRDAGFAVETVAVETRTLAAICRAHARGPIHFLKVDVEGAEAEVLGSGDFGAYRPWIVLVEATEPLSAALSHAEWEPALLAHGYRFAWFDGLNRFYLAAEHHDRLAHAFRVPPNPLDDWERAREVALASRAEAAEAAAAAATRDRDRTASALATLRVDHAVADGRRRDAAAARDAAAVERDWQGRRADRLADRLAGTEERLAGAETARADAAGRLADTARALLAEQAELDRLRPALADARRHVDRLDRLARELRWEDGPRALNLVLPVARTLRAAIGSRAPAPVPADPGAPDPVALAPPPAPPPVPALPPPTPTPALLPPAAAPIRARADDRRPATGAPPPRRAVHQYHAASADGDAISNGMLHGRAILRAMGFRSEIYVAHRHPAHDDTMLMLDELPSHDDHVLLAHHSLGDPYAARVAATDAPIVLVYHNITPAALLAEDPALADASRHGRAQLDWWRDRVHAAIADSELNALELRRHGFPRVSVSPFLFDTDALRERARRAAARARERGSPPADGAPFTVLFVGRIVASKGQADLVDAFAGFRRRFGAPARLVLVGRSFGDAGPSERAIRRRARRHGVADEVVLTGGVDDDALDDWYAAADAYASMSRHEGFGVPLVEAMAHGVPVVALAAGAVPFTVGDAGVLVDGADAVADALLALATDPARRDALAARGRDRLRDFDAARQRPSLLAALALAGAAPPAPVDRAALARTMHLVVAGHVNGSYSLAALNRALALAHEAAAPGRTTVVPVEGEPGATLHDLPDDEWAAVEALATAVPASRAPLIVLSQHYPVWVPDERALGDAAPALRVAYFLWEESLVPDATIATLSTRFDAVLTASRATAHALLGSGLRVPVRVVPFAPKLAPFRRLADWPERDGGRPFTFLHVSSGFPRKGVDVLLDAWAEAFTDAEDVRLVVKTFPNPHNDVALRIAALRVRHPSVAPIVHLDEDLPPAALEALYLGADTIVLPTRGEGFNIPAAEAMAAGVPLVVSAAGGHADWTGPATATLLPGRFAPSGSHLAADGSLWFEPDRDALVAALRRAADARDAGRDRAVRARDAVATALDPAMLTALLRDTLLDLLVATRPAGARRLLALTTWDVRCGIADYSRMLLGARPFNQAVTLTILADTRTPASAAVWPVWERADRFDADAVARAIGRADPEAVLIQHHPGLFSWRDLGRLLDDRRVRHRVTAVTLHNSAHLDTLDDAGRDHAVASLGRATRVIVHTVDDENRFRARGLDNVVTIPQGAPDGAPPADDASGDGHGSERPFDDPADAPLIGTYGFLLPPKGFAELIEAFMRVRRTWPGARLRMVTALYDDPSSAVHRDVLVDLTHRAGIADRVEWHTDFLPGGESLALLAPCDLLVMPYRPTREASSAALRTAMAAHRPLAVTPIGIFREVDDVVAFFADDTIEAMADGITLLLKDRGRRNALVRRQAGWLRARAWEGTARRVFGMLDGLVATRAVWPESPHGAGEMPGRCPPPAGA